MCVSAILLDEDTKSDYPFETLGKCGISGKPARFACIPLPGKENSKFWFATFPKNKFDDPQAHLLQTFRLFHEPVCDLIKYTFEKEIDLLVEHPQPLNLKSNLCNYKNNIAVIGDAWHSSFAGHNLAQGASVGIEDAWEMAFALANHDKLEA